MKNPLRTWMTTQRFKLKDLSRLFNVDSSTLYRWLMDKGTPNRRNALKMHKKTNGAVPFTYWGFVLLETGKVVKIEEREITTKPNKIG